MKRGEPSPWLVAVLAAAAGLGGALLANLRGGDEPAAPAAVTTSPPDLQHPGQWVAPIAPSRAGPIADQRTTVGVSVTGRGVTAAGAEVELHALEALADQLALLGRTTLDAQGRVVLQLFPGQYLVAIRQGGAAASQLFEVTHGHPQELLLTLEATWTARLRVVEADSRRAVAQPDATLVAQFTSLSTETPVAAATAHGDSLGRVQLDGLPAGAVRLRVTAREHLSAMVELAQGDGAEQEISLEPASFVTGTVLDENGTVLPRIRVTTGGHDDELTDAAGRFRVACRPGDVVVVAIDPAGRSATARVQVPEGGTAPNVELRLGEPRRLTGVVVDAASKAPVPGVTVRAWTFGGVEVSRAVTSSAGTFELDALPPGWVNVRATLGRGARAEALGVMTDSTQPVELALAAPAALWGIVTDGQGHAVAGARVAVDPAGTDGQLSAVTDDEGGYRLDDLLPVTVSVEATLDAATGTAAKHLTLTSGAASRVDLVIEQYGVVEGTVHGPPGKRFVITAFNDDDRLHRRFPVPADGRFRIDLLARAWRLSAHLAGGMLVRDDEQITVLAGQVVRRDLEVQPDDLQAMEEAFAVEAGTLGASFDSADGRVLFSWVVGNGPAGKAGIAAGELLLQVDGAEVRDSLDAFEKTRGAPGSTVSLVVRGAAGERTVSVQRMPHYQRPQAKAP